jgi:glycosyltransferase involved in cell wall biosynthesis
MRILFVKALLSRYHMLGADEQDAFASMYDMMRLGHEVKLLTMNNGHSTQEEGQRFFASKDITVELLPFRHQKIRLERFRELAFLLDGAAWEYAQPHFLKAVNHTLDTFKPDLVWTHASFMWPAVQPAYERGIPTVIRSVNYEPIHEFHFQSNPVANKFRYWGKLRGEQRALQNCHVMVAISPDEQILYESHPGHTPVKLMPLQGLAKFLRPPKQAIPDRKPLRVFTMGSSYNMPHNLHGLAFIVEQIIPRLRQEAPGRFKFHVLGDKMPQHILDYAGKDLYFDGFVPDIESHLEQMDIALMPSLFGQGMQQKIFESLCRGFPTITHERGLAGYPFEDGQHVLLGSDADSFIQQLYRLEDTALRQKIAEGARQKSGELFNQDALDHRFAEIFEILNLHVA